MSENAMVYTSFKPRVLVVDDEKRIRDGCHKMLTIEGFDVARAETGDQGLDMIEKEHFDIILLDLMMPGISGMDVLERVRELHPDTVVIVITGYATLEHSIEAMKKGAFDFIPKPFSPQELRGVVSKAIRHIRTLQDIAHEKSRMRVLINYLADGVMATDNEKHVALANPAFLRLTGFTGSNVIGLPVSEIVPNERVLEMINQALAMGEDDFVALTDELPCGDDEDGDGKILGVRCVPFRDRLGRNLGTVTVLRDITALKKMDQIKSDFVSMVAHEIRSPMNSVLMQMKVIQDGLAGEVSGKQKEILQRASEKIKGLVAMSSELLDIAKIESGLITQEREKLNMGPLLADQVAFHQARAEARKIALENQAPGQLPPIMANRRNMEEVLSNLITNAINYTPEGGRVTVSAGVENDFLVVKVKDTGFGIAHEELEKIFNRFYRVKNEKTRFVVGTGLGLSIVKSIVEAHHGRIRVESKPDQGSIFLVHLPLLSH